MHRKLEPFIGTWTVTGKEDSFKEVCEWFDGGHQVLCRLVSSNENKTVTGMSILGYSSHKEKFTYYGFNSLGRNSYQLGENNGKVFTFIGEGKHNQVFKPLRTTIIFSEDLNSSEFTVEYSENGEWKFWEKETIIKIHT